MEATGVLTQWATPEQAGDTGTLVTRLAIGFTAVGTLGFILPKQAWLARHRSRDLSNCGFSLGEIEDLRIGQEAVPVTARTNTRGSHQRHPIPEAICATLFLASDAGRWQLAPIDLSFIAGTAGAPPIPGAGPGQPQRYGGGA
jgi:hypothetical protein